MTESKKAKEVRPDPALKWGVTPGKYPPAYTKPEEEYSPEEQASRQKMREKGVNPDSKAQMDAATKGTFWKKWTGMNGFFGMG
ncbi:hypothetical protein LTR78_003503 [Recurvomyces mirabilis]|uniref:Uncharacterized protein n=1 Tax=Recurvomyces mirabilis TaxID=574656 RepID=A0AAE1C3E9_9PEZI|nr:hypothetical protein LTR78_003503 [Recurvomyces mirabilis]KAK5154464.1 hypothetical protein LTS14_006599 [Recurvomyces mirabilis]